MKPCIAAACLLMSCASPQEDAAVSDFATPYDGDWRALMRNTEIVQHVGGYRFDCAPFTESFFLRVKSGIASGFMEADENYSFTARIDGRGRFRALIPTNSVYTYKDVAIDRESNIVLVLQGQLLNGEQSGVFVIGDEAIDGQGCATQVQFVAI